MFCCSCEDRVSQTVLMYSLISLTNFPYSSFKEAEREDVSAVDFSYSVHVNIALVCASDIAWPTRPPSL